MRVAGHPYALLSNTEIERIHQGALRIMAEMGMVIQNDVLLQALAERGLPVDFSTQRVRFPAAFVERFLADAEKRDWENFTGRVGGSAGIYHGRFHDPLSGELVEWDEERLAYYFCLARKLSHIHGASMLGSRLPCPAPLEPLYERYYNWKYGGHEGSSIYLDETCPHLFELYQVQADIQGKPVQDVFRGTVYLIPALKLGQHEAYQVQYFRERGLRVHIGDMYGMGANAPVTLAGALTLNLAEQFILRILDWVWFDDRTLRLGGSISVMDMRTMIYPYGRPEMAVANLMLAQIARYYGASYSGHAGLSDAKLPSVEAGYQKALTALPTLMACGNFSMDAGLLSIDEVCSPIQLILDNEFLSALDHFAKEFEVSEESIGIDTILAAGPAGQYLDKEHTVKYMRREQWQPKLWSREMLLPWMGTNRSLDADRARDIALAIRKEEYLASQLAPDHEKAILDVIEHAHHALAL